MRIRARIEHDRVAGMLQKYLVELIAERSFEVALKKFRFVSVSRAIRGDFSFNIRKGLAAVDALFPKPRQIEIDPVDDEKFHIVTSFISLPYVHIVLRLLRSLQIFRV